MNDDIREILSFIREAEGLKSVTRTAWSAQGRRESTAEHSWRLALFAGVLLDKYPGLNKEKVLLMCLIHDLGELYEGDISAALCPDEAVKHAEELRDVTGVFSFLPADLGEKLLKIWKEYDQNSSEEAHLVKALDKAETILQHNQGKNPEDFDYDFNLDYGKEYFMGDKTLEEIRQSLDKETSLHCGTSRK